MAFSGTKALLRRILPASVKDRLKTRQLARRKAQLESVAAMDEVEFRSVLTDTLGVKSGDTVLVHNSVDLLHLDFPFMKILPMLRDIVGEPGTVAFPTFPGVSSYEALASGEAWHAKKSRCYTGILGEFGRRQRSAVRSIHPTRSIAALGARAEELCASHHQAPSPFGKGSPYDLLAEMDGKVIGVGVSTRNLSLVHLIDDLLGEEFPIDPYRTEEFVIECTDQKGEVHQVPSRGHDLAKMRFDIPRFVANHLSDEAAQDFTVRTMEFFAADAKKTRDEMLDLAGRGITLYTHS